MTSRRKVGTEGPNLATATGPALVRGIRRLARGRSGVLIRAFFSGVLIVVVLGQIDIGQLSRSLRSVNGSLLALALLATFLGKLITASRWRLLLQMFGVRADLRRLISVLFVGSLFNSVAPSTVGGDLYRVYDVARGEKQRVTLSLGAVVLDRGVGMFALATVALIALRPALALGESILPFAAPVVAIFFSLVIIIAIGFSDRVWLRIAELGPLPWIPRIAEMCSESRQLSRLARRSYKILIGAFLLSLLLQVNVVLQYLLIGKSLDLVAPTAYYFLGIPIVLLIVSLPVTINGIGLRESAMALVFGVVGVPIEDATALSLIAFGMLVVHSAIGGLILIARTPQKESVFV